MADKSYDNDDDLDREGIPVLQDSINVDEGMIPPRDHARAAESFGTTSEEERREESLEDRAVQELPDLTPESIDVEDADDSDEGRPLDARLVEPGSYDVDQVDEEKDTVAVAFDEDEGAFSAEESALHITENP